MLKNVGLMVFGRLKASVELMRIQEDCYHIIRQSIFFKGLSCESMGSGFFVFHSLIEQWPENTDCMQVVEDAFTAPIYIYIF